MIDRTYQALRSIARAEMKQDSAHDLAHLDRVWVSCQTLAEVEGADLKVLVAAAYLHDLVNLPKDAPNRSEASRLAAAAAVPHLEALGYEADDIAAVCHAIEAHSFSAGITPTTPEAKILRDADRLDAIGAIGLARVFAVSGALGRRLYDMDDPFCTARTPDDTQFAIDHFRTKLLGLPDGMTTDAGRIMAIARGRILLDFLDELAQEIGHNHPVHWRPEDTDV